MKIVRDTNILISTFAFKGNTRKVYSYCADNEEIFLSDFIIDELTDKLLHKFETESALLNEILKTIHEDANIIQPENELPSICRDKDDNHILQLAEYIEADYIITGDKDLLALEHFKGTIITTPRVFHALIFEE